MTDTLIIGRDREIARLDLAVGPGRDGLRYAMLSGPSGLGKTTLANNTARRAEGRGFRVATIRGRAGSLSTPFAPFIEAMPEFQVLLSVLTGDHVADIEHAGIGLVNLLIELSVERPLLLIFDDAQALDESSIALLPYISGVSTRADITMLFVEQTDAIGIPDSYRAFVEGLLARRIVSHLELQSMSSDAVRELVAHVMLLDDPAMVPEVIVDRSGGNPWFAKELALAYEAGVTDIPSTIAASATARLMALDEAGQDLVSATALCPEGAHIGWLEALSGERPRQFVRTMERVQASGLIREDGEVVTIAHPLMQQALSDDLSVAMRRSIHRELAEVIAEVPLAEVTSARGVGYHLAQAGRPDEAVEHFLRAAQSNEITGQLHEAYADLLRALHAEPRTDRRSELLKRCARMAMQLGMSASVDHWTELGRLAASTGDDELYAYALFQQYWASNDGTANERLHRAAGLGADSIGWSARAAATIARMDGRLVDAIHLDSRAIELARINGDPTLEVLALEKLASSQADLGQSRDAIATYRMAIERAIANRMHDWAAISWGCLVETLLDELETDAAVQEAKAIDQYVSDLGIDHMRPAVLAWQASALLRAGDLEEAAAVIEVATSLDLGFRADPSYRRDHFGALVLLIRAEIANELGLADAYDRADRACTIISSLGFRSWLLEANFERTRSIARRDGMAAALPLLADVETSGEPAFIAGATRWLLRASIVSEDGPGIERARQIRTTSQAWSENVVTELARDEIDAMLGLLDGADITSLDVVAHRWTTASRALDALRCNMVTGAIALRRGDKELAKIYLHAAKVGLAKCGASADADQVASLLRQTGARSRASSRTTQVGPLTKRELEIARLVASGLKNSEVAATLFLAEKTVAAHLSNIYGKVEVRSRVQLTGWIREHDTEFVASYANAG
ncbi:MAG: AAA family ATPase [Thermoleophilia bacterium]|nr:AAA family ATPase [Thermoleophilia bacterium]